MKIYLRDVLSIPVPGRPAGYCVPGMRAFAKRHGLDMRTFLHDGIDAEVLLGTGDAMAAKAVEHVRKLRGIDG